MIWLALSIAVVAFLFSGVRIVRPVERGLVERLGKYRRLAVPGFNWVIPAVDTMYRVNVTEMMVDAQPQEIITNDNLQDGLISGPGRARRS